MIAEPDMDFHIRLQLDPEFTNAGLINQENKRLQHNTYTCRGSCKSNWCSCT
jgi:hypothetical protein